MVASEVVEATEEVEAVESVPEVSVVELPQAAIEAARARARIAAITFFMIKVPFYKK